MSQSARSPVSGICGLAQQHAQNEQSDATSEAGWQSTRRRRADQRERERADSTQSRRTDERDEVTNRRSKQQAGRQQTMARRPTDQAREECDEAAEWRPLIDQRDPPAPFLTL